MTHMSSILRRAALAALLLALVPAAAAAQANPNRPAVSIAGGARIYDRVGEETPTAVSVAIRSELPLGQHFVLELAGSVADVPEGTTRGVANLFESQLQLALPLGERLAPYVGAGVGAANVQGFGLQDDAWKAVFTAGAGVRAMFSDNLGMVADARIRGGSEVAGHVDATLGVRYVFGRVDRPRFRGGRTR